MEGQWVVTPVVIEGHGGRRVRTDPMPVMAVTRVTCLKDARNCSPKEHPQQVAMLGIGYGREADDQFQSTPDHNPFLRLVEEAPGRLRRRYIVTRDGVSVELGNILDPAFWTVRLQRNGRGDDWLPAPICLSLAGRTPPACGTVLVDTGVSRSFLSAPEEQLKGLMNEKGLQHTILRGTEISVQLSRGTDPFWGYRFQTGDLSNPLAPDGITVVHTHGPTFINTSVHILNGFDVLYDADQGIAGYRPRT
jgi:hypothetical protein